MKKFKLKRAVYLAAAALLLVILQNYTSLAMTEEQYNQLVQLLLNALDALGLLG